MGQDKLIAGKKDDPMYKPLSPGALYLGDRLIWENPPELGHFAIKLRKQLLEEEIIERIERRHRALLFLRFNRFNDFSLLPYLGTTAETPEEIERAFKRCIKK